jgi:hypothetical protein
MHLVAPFSLADANDRTIGVPRFAIPHRRVARRQLHRAPP